MHMELMAHWHEAIIEMQTQRRGNEHVQIKPYALPSQCLKDSLWATVQGCIDTLLGTVHQQCAQPFVYFCQEAYRAKWSQLF